MATICSLTRRMHTLFMLTIMLRTRACSQDSHYNEQKNQHTIFFSKIIKLKSQHYIYSVVWSVTIIEFF